MSVEDGVRKPSVYLTEEARDARAHRLGIRAGDSWLDVAFVKRIAFADREELEKRQVAE